jgi:hypothetical protein
MCGTLTDTWTYTDACQRTISGSRTVTVTAAPIAHFVTPPQNVTVACGATIPSVPVVQYTNEGSGGCVISGQVTAVRTGNAPACGGTLTDTWTFIDACQRTISGSRTITVTPAPIAHFVTPPAT